MRRLFSQLLLLNPFKGDVRVSRVWVTRPSSRGSTLPFPSRANYRQPLDILDTFFAKADRCQGDARNNRYLEIPGVSPVLVTRDPGVIRAVLTATGDREGQFDRDTMPSTGIARATGPDTLLFSNGPQWRSHRKASSRAFGKTALFQPNVFEAFEQTFRDNVVDRISALKSHLQETGQSEIEIRLEPEIKCIMLEMLLHNFFGAHVAREDLQTRYIPAIDRIIEHIVRDTIEHRFQFNPLRRRSQRQDDAQLEEDFELFERLTDLSITPRTSGGGAWARVDRSIDDGDLRSNIKVFLAGALEATTSYAAWAVSHLSRNPDSRQKVFDEVREVDRFATNLLETSRSLRNTLRETLRLTPSLYFLPRRASVDTWIETDGGRKLWLPRGTHILLDVWHANRLEEHWGREKTGYPASEFHPDRWDNIDASERPKDFLHFGFGYGARVCPGQHLGELETALVVGGIVKLFDFEGVSESVEPKAGVSTKPDDGVLVRLRLRQ